ncbi:MAG: MFS transporter [Candidatus Nanopelagicales bacterium]
MPALPADAPDGDAVADQASVPAGYERWVRNTSLFLIGQLISLFGSSLVQYAILWHLTLTTKSGVVLTLGTIAGFLPQGIVSIFGGVWADRHNRKWLSIGADATIAATTLVLAFLLLRGSTSLWIIYAALMIRSTGAGIQQPAVTALIPQLVPPAQLMRVNGLNASFQSGLFLVAPAVAAAVYAGAGLSAVLFVDVVTAVLGIAMLLLVPVGPVPRDSAEHPAYFADLRRGFSYVHGHKLVRIVLGYFALLFVLVVPASYLTPLMVVRSFGPEVWKLTALEVAFSLGNILGGAVLAWKGAGWDRITMLAGAALAFGALSSGMGLAGVLWVFLALMFASGLALPFFATVSTTMLQETVDPQMQGRVFGLLGIVMALAMPLGMVIFGPLADRTSVENILIGTGVATVVVGLPMLLRRQSMQEEARRAVAALAAGS